jgi:hypothetical protein
MRVWEPGGDLNEEIIGAHRPYELNSQDNQPDLSTTCAKVFLHKRMQWELIVTRPAGDAGLGRRADDWSH